MKRFILVVLVFVLNLQASQTTCSYPTNFEDTKIEYIRMYLGKVKKMKVIEPISISVIDRVWAEKEVKYELIAGDKYDFQFEEILRSKLTAFEFYSYDNEDFIGVGGYGYAYGYAYRSPTLELVLDINDAKDIDIGFLGTDKDNIFVQGKYGGMNVATKSTQKYLIVWFNLNDLPCYFSSKIKYIKILDK